MSCVVDILFCARVGQLVDKWIHPSLIIEFNFSFSFENALLLKCGQSPCGPQPGYVFLSVRTSIFIISSEFRNYVNCVTSKQALFNLNDDDSGLNWDWKSQIQEEHCTAPSPLPLLTFWVDQCPSFLTSSFRGLEKLWLPPLSSPWGRC